MRLIKIDGDVLGLRLPKEELDCSVYGYLKSLLGSH
jgi:hypothetical protein